MTTQLKLKRLATLLLALLAGAGCAGRPAADAAAHPPPGGPAELSALLSLPGLRFEKQPALAYHGAEYGAAFASDLPASRCVASGKTAGFTPQYDPATSRGLADAAFCLYRLRLEATAAPVTLSLDWKRRPRECWLGLADWTAQAWRWYLLPADAALPLADPQPLSDASGLCLVAVVALDSEPCSLASLGFDLALLHAGDGYTLLAPMPETATTLIDMEGQVVHSWSSQYRPGLSAQLTSQGHLLRQACVENQYFVLGGSGGRLEEFDWDGQLVWYYELSTDQQCTHHDFEVLPSGDILLTVWQRHSAEELTAAGRDLSRNGYGELWIDQIVEIAPRADAGADVVWHWDAFEHVIQDFDPSKANYGDPAANPELADMNYSQEIGSDWLHINAISYNAALDQIALSIYGFSAVWIIDHSTTTAEAASHSGGRYGHGGDLLYRWGNSQAYRAGSETDRVLNTQHDVHWIPPGLEGAGDLLIFNNRAGYFKNAPYSEVIEITPPLNPDGSYTLTSAAYGPAAATWTYTAYPPPDFYSQMVSSAQRLRGGNTLICSGAAGRIFEVTPAGLVVWLHTLSQTVFSAQRYTYDYPGVAALQPAADPAQPPNQ